MFQLNISGKLLRQLAFVLVTSGFALPAASVVDAQAPEPIQFGRKIAEICRKHDVPAMAAAFVNSEGIVEAKCSGDRKRGTKDKVQISDRFPIGSCTKSMTATLAAVLVDADKIQWSTTIGEVWPQATGDSIHPNLRNVTLDELLSHQSGLPENISDISEQAWASFFQQSQSPVLERRRMLKLVLSKKPANPHGKLAYSNLGYAIVAAMLETRAREPFESLMKKHVFGQLEMKSADFRTNESAKQLQPPLLWGHETNGQPIDPRVNNAENPTVYASAGTVHLTIEDFAKYARWHLIGKPEPVLQSQETFDHLHAPLVDYTIPGAKYACGWICMNMGFGPALNHAGSNTNSFALVWVLPDSDFAAVACTNTFEPQAFPACDEMIGHLMMQHAKKLGAANSKPAAPPVANQMKVAPQRLVGKYQLAPTFVFDVRYNDGHLTVGITNQPTNELFPDSPTLWSYRGLDAKIEFHVSPEGPAHALTLHQNGHAQKAKRVRD